MSTKSNHGAVVFALELGWGSIGHLSTENSILKIFFHFISVQIFMKPFDTLVVREECMDLWHLKIKWNRRIMPADLQKSDSVQFPESDFSN